MNYKIKCYSFSEYHRTDFKKRNTVKQAGEWGLILGKHERSKVSLKDIPNEIQIQDDLGFSFPFHKLLNTQLKFIVLNNNYMKQ